MFDSSYSEFSPYLLPILIIFLILVLFHFFALRPLPLIPFPLKVRYLPIFGHLFSTLPNFGRMLGWKLSLAHSISNRFGLFQLCFPFNSPLIELISSSGIESILKKNFDSVVKGRIVNEASSELLGDGIFNSDGEKWRKQRKIASYMFNSNQLYQNMANIFMKHSEKVIQIFNLVIDNDSNNSKNKNNENYQFDLQDCFYRFSLDSMCLISFSYDCGGLFELYSKYNFIDNNRNNNRNLSATEFQFHFDRAQELTAQKMAKPSIVWKFEEIFKNSKKQFQLKESVKIINSYVEKVIKQRIDGIEKENEIKKNFIPKDHNEGGENNEEGSDNSDLLSLFIKHQNILDSHENLMKSPFPDDLKYTNPSIDNLPSFNSMRDLVLNFLIAGRDTTASALSNFIFMISKFPEEEEKIRLELELYFHSDSSLITPESVKSLIYLESSILESMRLNPPVPANFKIAKENFQIPLDSNSSVNIPKDTVIYYSPYIIHRMKNIWGNEADSFKPERWIKIAGEKNNSNNNSSSSSSSSSSSNSNIFSPIGHEYFDSIDSHSSLSLRSISQFKYLTFNAGPRICIGKSTAMLEMKILLAIILTQFKFKIDPKWKSTKKLSTTLAFQNGLPVKIEKIEKNKKE